MTNLTKLKVLDLRNNQITKLDFTLPSSLEKLWLLENKIEGIKSGTFRNLENLKELSLSVADIPTDIDLAKKLKNNKKLESLYLEGNSKTKISSDLLEDKKCIKSLDLINHDIKTITKELFKGLRTLEVLCLKRNNIRAIEPNAFEDLENLNHIDLSENMLTNLNLEQFENLAKKNLEDLWLLENDGLDELVEPNGLTIIQKLE